MQFVEEQEELILQDNHRITTPLRTQEAKSISFFSKVYYTCIALIVGIIFILALIYSYSSLVSSTHDQLKYFEDIGNTELKDYQDFEFQNHDEQDWDHVFKGFIKQFYNEDPNNLDQETEKKMEKEIVNDILGVDEDQDQQLWFDGVEDNQVQTQNAPNEFHNDNDGKSEQTYEELRLKLESPVNKEYEAIQLKNGLKVVVIPDEWNLMLVWISKGFHEEVGTEREGFMGVIMHQILQNEECWRKGVGKVETEVYSMNSMLSLANVEVECMTRIAKRLAEPAFNEEKVIEMLAKVRKENQIQSSSLSRISWLLEKLENNQVVKPKDDGVNLARELSEYYSKEIGSNKMVMVIKSRDDTQELIDALRELKQVELGGEGSQSPQLEIPQSKLNSSITFQSYANKTFYVYQVSQQSKEQQDALKFINYLLNQADSSLCGYYVDGVLVIDDGQSKSERASYIHQAASWLNALDWKTLTKHFGQFQEYSRLQFQFDNANKAAVLEYAKKLSSRPLTPGLLVEHYELKEKAFKQVLQGIKKGVIVMRGSSEVGETDIEPFQLEAKEASFELVDISEYLPGSIEAVQLCSEDEIIPAEMESSLTVETEAADGAYAETDPVLVSSEINDAFEFSLLYEFGECGPDVSSAMDTQLNAYLLQKTSSAEVWWKYSRKSPRVQQGILLHRSREVDYQTSKAVLKIGQKYLQEQLQARFKKAIKAGYKIQVESNHDGLLIYLSGWSHTYGHFLSQFLSSLRDGTLHDEEVFLRNQQYLVDDFNRFYGEQLEFLIVQYYLPKIMMRPVTQPTQIVTQISAITFKQFNSHLTSLIHAFDARTLFYGNIAPDDPALHHFLADDDDDSFSYYETKTLATQGHSYVYLQEAHLDSQDNHHAAVINFYQTGNRDTQQMALLLFSQIFFQLELDKSEDDLLKDVRTSTAKFKSIGCSDGLAFYFESASLSPYQMNQYIEAFLKARIVMMRDVSPSRFDQIKEQLVMTLRQTKSSEDEADYLWDKIVYRNYGFGEIEQLIAKIDEWTVDQVGQQLPDLFASVGKISLQVVGKQFTNRDDSGKLLKAEYTLNNLDEQILDLDQKVEYSRCRFQFTQL